MEAVVVLLDVVGQRPWPVGADPAADLGLGQRGQDQAGNAYAASLDGTLYRVTASPR